MVGRLIEGTGLVEQLRRCAGLAVRDIRAALLSVHAMLSHEDWKELLMAGGDLRRDEWRHRLETLKEMYSECYRIPQAIYTRGSPALRGYPPPSYQFSG